MISDWMAFAALLAVHIGCAAILGNSLRVAPARAQRMAALAAFAAVLALALSLPLASLAKLGLVAAALAAFAGFAFAGFSYLLPRPAWFYAAGTMLLIFAWSLTLGWFNPALGIGLASVGAGLMAFRRAVTTAG
ncbi:MAG: hypothetical protein WD751_08790 [Anaerolineales bacterium]